MKFSFARGAPAWYIADMKTLLALVAVATLAGSPAWADTSSTHEAKNTQQYGNCAVSTGVDMFTDEEVHVCICLEETLTDTTSIGFRMESGNLLIALSKGLQFHVEDYISVAVRIDKGPLIKRRAYWNSHNSQAAISDEQLARQLLHDLARGQRVAIQVGAERGHIQLDGSLRAVADFRQRAGLQPQQTLTPTQRQTLEIPTHNH